MMSSGIAISISLIALFFSVIALSITYRKEAHRIRLELTILKYNCAVIGIVNDSGIDTTVKSIGFFYRDRSVTWLPDTTTIGNNKTNKPQTLPIIAGARSTFEAHLNLNHINLPHTIQFPQKAGICIQLDTGRIYVYTNQVNVINRIFMHLASLVSRLVSPKYALGVQRPRIKVY